MPQNSGITEEQLVVLKKTNQLFLHLHETSHQIWISNSDGTSLSLLVKKLKKREEKDSVEHIYAALSRYLKGIRKFFSDVLQNDFKCALSEVRGFIQLQLEQASLNNDLIEKNRKLLESYKYLLTNETPAIAFKLPVENPALVLGAIVSETDNLIDIYYEAMLRVQELAEYFSIVSLPCPEFIPSLDYRSITYKGEKLPKLSADQGKILKLIHEAHLSPNPEIGKAEIMTKIKGHKTSKWSNAIHSRKDVFEKILKEDAAGKIVSLNISCKHN